jgi:hypothetical protein
MNHRMRNLTIAAIVSALVLVSIVNLAFFATRVITMVMAVAGWWQ